MYELAVNLELLFTEAGRGDKNVTARLAAASAAGFGAAEIWFWRGKDIPRLREALQSTPMRLQTMCVEPMGRLVDPATHDTFLSALVESAAAARTLDCPYLVMTAGDHREGRPRVEQHRAIVQALRAAATLLDSFDVTLLLENLNSRVDHVGTFLDSTAECLDIIEEVDSPQVRLLYDHYHSLMMGERPEHVLQGRSQLVGHVQIADVPGRQEPGTGTVDWSHELRILTDLGYRGRIGLECLTSTDTMTSLHAITQVVAAFNAATAADGAPLGQEQ
jgi:hydroxypyruvate isomerase